MRWLRGPADAGHARALARVGASLGPVLAGWGLVLASLNGLDLGRVFAQFLAVNAAAALGFSVVGALVALKRPHHTVAWLCIAVGLASGASVWAGQYARYALLTAPGSAAGGEIAAWVNLWLWLLPAAGVAVYLPLIFPTGHLPSRRWRVVLWLATAAMLLLIVLTAVGPEPDASLPEVPNPLAIPALAPLVAGLMPLAGALAAAALIGALGSLVARCRAAGGVEQQQLKWLLSAVATVLAVFGFSAWLHMAGFPGGTLASGALQALAVPLVPAAVAVAVLRHRLYDIDVLINRTLVYGALSAAVIGGYVIVVGVAGALLRTQESLGVSLLGAAVVAVLFQPLRMRLQRAVNRLLYGRRDEPYAVLSALDRRLASTIAPDEVLPTIVETLREALRLPYVAIALGPTRTGSPIAVASGTAAGDLLCVPLVYQGEQVGEVRLAPRAPGEELSGADRRLIEGLARHAGAAAHAVRLTADLRHARERVVRAREEERRRLRRDLHDGLGPRLASLTMRLEAARDRATEDGDTAAVLADLAERTRAAVTEVRRLVRGLRPPALDDLGLASALREVADQYSLGSGAGLCVTADIASDLPPLPAAVEVATYHIAQEALTNAARHARASTCTLRVHFDAHASALHLEVLDNGRGLDPGAARGVGLASMRERAEEVGGTFSCAPAGPGGGTRVRAILPFSAAAAGATTTGEGPREVAW